MVSVGVFNVIIHACAGKIPPQSWYKVNVDAAVGFKNVSTSLEVLIRNLNSEVMIAFIWREIFTGDVGLVEAISLQKGIQFVKYI